MSDAPKDPMVALLDKHVHALSEHFDNVQIFVNRLVEGGEKTRYLSRGGGNMFARYGQVRDWVMTTEEQSKRDAVKESEDER